MWVSAGAARRSDDDRPLVAGVVFADQRPSEFLPFRLLQSAAGVTGGEFLRSNRGARLRETCRGILDQYRQRYLLTYSPAGPSAPGWHRLDVRLRSRAGNVVAHEDYTAR